MSVILKNIPQYCREEELRGVLSAYGTPVAISISPHMPQATVTMRTQHEARALLAQRCINFFGHSMMVEPDHYAAGSSAMPGMVNQYNTGTRINVVVERCVHTVTKDVLSHVFGMVAQSTNVFCGPPGTTTTGWVDYADAATAQMVVQRLNKNPIYPDCCYMTLSIDNGAGSHAMGGAYPPAATPYQQHQQQPQHHQQAHHQQAHHQHQHQHHSHQHAHHQHHHSHQHQHQHHSHHQQHQSMPFGHTNYGAMPGSIPPRGGMVRGRGRGAMAARMGHTAPYGGPLPHQQFAGAPHGVPPTDTVVIVSNVPETVSLNDLWILLEVHGNVNSLRRQFSSKTKVVAHFQNVHDARLAVQHLQGCPFHGSTLSLKTFAGYTDRGGRTEWNSGPATDPETQAVDFSIGYHHRTKPSAAYNPTGRVRPDKNLFISNLTEAISDDEIKETFSDAGFNLEGYFRKSPSVAIVSLPEIQEAVHALIAVHSKKLKERFLRVTFSHFPPGPRANGDGDKDKASAEDASENHQEEANEAAVEVANDDQS